MRIYKEANLQVRPAFLRLTPVLAVGLTSLFGGVVLTPAARAQQSKTGTVTLNGHIAPIVKKSQHLGRYAATAPMILDISLPLRNEASVNELAREIYEPGSAYYGRYLTPAEFTADFGPTQADYNAVVAYAEAKGFKIITKQPTRTLLTIQGTQAQVEAAFGVTLDRYMAPNGHVFHAPTTEPKISIALSGIVQGIIGLSNSFEVHPVGLHKVNAHAAKRRQIAAADETPDAIPPQQGTGYLGGFVPSDIRTAYNLGTALTGSGQTLGLFELDNYLGKDIQRYELDNGLTAVPLLNVDVDATDPNFPTVRGENTNEVVIDIDLQIALAPSASDEYVYLCPNDDSGILDGYARIASDNLAKSVSTSWGGSEASTTLSFMNAEDQAYYQMAMQGQSIYAATGDYGTYPVSTSTSMEVQDPAVEEYMCSVGGTTLTVVSPGSNETYSSEVVWNNFQYGYTGASGGGVSTFVPIPFYQVNAATYAANNYPSSGVSTTYRNIPDVALDADPQTGYLVYISDPSYGANYYVYAGTSAAAPLWAGFTALVNQSRASLGSAALGFPNTALYSLGPTATAIPSTYTNDFHDITSGNNSYSGSTSPTTLYPAVVGYDDATGLGTFNGLNLIANLKTYTQTKYPKPTMLH